MREARVTVVLSQGQSRSPDKRQLENDIAQAAAALPGVEVLVVPHLYDLARDGETYQRLRAIEMPLIVCTWLFDRAAHWVLDRNGVRGQFGETMLSSGDDEQDDDAPNDSSSKETSKSSERVTDSYPRPARPIYCLDLRDSSQATAFVQEIERIVALCASGNWPASQGGSTSSTSFVAPGNDTYVGHLPVSLVSLGPTTLAGNEPTLHGTPGVTTISEHPSRRWYPVIDFSRCTNCMECIDFCLFGVYGIDSVETILVEQPDNCRKGCPACSRVCPQNAIIFPQHKTPAIAGAPMDAGGFKIDLSKLFGAPDEGADALEVAARERDEQLLLAGRQAVGVTEDLASRLSKTPATPPDDLDNLIDQLDSLEL